MTRHSRKAGVWIALATCTALALTACAGFSKKTTGPADGTAKVTVRFTYLWSGAEAAAVEKIISSFNASQDKITVVGTSNPDQQAQVLSMQGTNPQFDISATGNSQIVQWAKINGIAALDEHISADKYDTADFLPSAIKNNTVGGKLYALPIASNTYQLLYNKKLLATAGFPDGPKTFEDWATVINKLTSVTDGKITAMGTNPSVDYALMVQAYGGSWYDGNGNPTPDNPINIEAMQWWVTNVIKPYGAKQLQNFQSGFGEYGTAKYPFYTGEIATLIDGNWQSAFISKLAPDLDWGVAPLPHPAAKPGVAGTSRLDLSNLFIPANSAHPKEAWAFMSYFLATEQMRDFTLALANLPGRTALLDDPAYAKLPNFAAFLQAAKSPRNEPAYSTAYSAQYGQDLSAAFSKIAAGEADPATALAEVARKAKAYDR